MEEARACAACLASDVSLHSMGSDLMEAYKQLCVGGPIDSGMPQLLCWECAALVHKFNKFRRKCKRAYVLLQEICYTHNMVTAELVQSIDRKQHGLSSALGCSGTEIQVWPRDEDQTVKNKGICISGVPALERNESCFEFEVALECTQDDVNVKKAPTNENDSDFFNQDDCDFDSIQDVGRETPHKQKSTLTLYKKSREMKREYLSKNSEDVDFSQDIEVSVQDYAKSIGPLNRKRTKKLDHKLNNLNVTEDILPQQRGGFECDICKKKFGTKETVRIHIGLKHEKQNFCDIRPEVLHARLTAKHNLTTHTKLSPVLKKLKQKKKSVREKVPASRFSVVEVLLSQEQMTSAVRERQNSEAYKASRFKCTLCYKRFLENKTYSNHMLLHDKVSGEYECDVCRLRLRTRLLLHRHISGNHMRRYSCERCPYVCYNRSSARAHFAWHEGVVFTCHICGATFRKTTTHLSHLRLKHASRYACAECGESFLNAGGLARHRRLMHAAMQDTRNPPVTTDAGPYCTVCKVHFTTAEARNRHIMISSEHENLKSTIFNGCRDCGRTFPTRPELRLHRRAAHPPRAPRRRRAPAARSCTECSERFTSAAEFRAHFEKEHPGLPPPSGTQISLHICEVCGRAFKCNATLQIHMSVHTGARDYKCAVCPKSFGTPVGLKAHLASHSDARPYPCAECGKGFKLATARDRHQRLHSGVRPYECNVCGKTFSTSTGRNAHSRNVHKAETDGPTVRRK